MRIPIAEPNGLIGSEAVCYFDALTQDVVGVAPLIFIRANKVSSDHIATSQTPGNLRHILDFGAVKLVCGMSSPRL
jgi:hypothetical protein